MGLLLLALIISDLNKALYSRGLIGVICKLSIPSLGAHAPSGAAGPVDQRMFKHGRAPPAAVQVCAQGVEARKVCQRGGHGQHACVICVYPAL